MAASVIYKEQSARQSASRIVFLSFFAQKQPFVRPVGDFNDVAAAGVDHDGVAVDALGSEIMDVALMDVSVQEIARMMEEETYMTPMEAVRLGFADTIRNANSEKTGVVNGLYSRKKGAAVYDERLKDAIAAVCLKLEEATFSANDASHARHEDTQGADALLEEARRRLALRGRLGNRQTF